MAIYSKPTTDDTNNEMVDHPSHYNQFKREVIEEMRLLFGDEAVKSFCKLNAYKYMRRADYKGKKEEDLAKAEWYMDYLDKMERERIAKLAAPKPEPIHVVLDTSNVASAPECCDPGFYQSAPDYTHKDSITKSVDPIDPSQNSHVVNYAHNDNIVQNDATSHYREERWPG
jgi:hypothetical protein